MRKRNREPDVLRRKTIRYFEDAIGEGLYRWFILNQDSPEIARDMNIKVSNVRDWVTKFHMYKKYPRCLINFMVKNDNLLSIKNCKEFNRVICKTYEPNRNIKENQQLEFNFGEV